MSLDLATVTEAAFQPHLGTEFEVLLEGRAPLTLRLDAAAPYPR